MSQQGDAPPDPNRRDFLRKIGLGGPVAIGGILAAGGLSVSGGLNQALTDALYIKKNPLGAENVIQIPSDNIPGLAILGNSDSDTGTRNSILRLQSPLGKGWNLDLPAQIKANIYDTDGVAVFMAVRYLNNSPAGDPAVVIITFFPDTGFPAPNSHAGDLEIGDANLGLFLNWQAFGTEVGKGGVQLLGQIDNPADVGLPTSDQGGVNFKSLGYADHRHAFTGRFFFNAFISDLALGAVLPVIWQRSIIANAITLRRITVDSLTPSTGVGNDTIRCGDGTNFLSVNLPAGGTTATATGTVNIAAGATLRIDVSARDTVPSKAVNVAVDYTMNQ